MPATSECERLRSNGYAMVALLVAMSVMAIMMTVAMPVWRQTAQREKEDELVFRGLQYARAIGLYEKKFANAPPPSIDVLVQQRYLRKKYKDPITNDDFVPILAGQATPATAAPQGRAGAPAAAPIGQPLVATGGITGVTSKSTAASLRIYNGHSHYNEWLFVYAPPSAAPGAGGGLGGGVPGQRGQQPNPGGPGPIGGGNRGGRGANGPGGRGGPGGPGGTPAPAEPGGARGQGGAPGGAARPFNPFQLPTDAGPGRGR